MNLRKANTQNKVRIIFFSTSQSGMRQFEFNLKKLVLILFFAGFVVGGLFMASATISNSLDYRANQTTIEDPNSYLRGQVADLKDDIDRLSSKLKELEGYNDDLELLVGLSDPGPEHPFVADQTQISTMQDQETLLMSAMPVDFEYETDQISDFVNHLEHRIQRAMDVQGSIEDQFLQREKPIKYIPSIRPVVDARITDKFGKRKDPFVARVKHHNGIDLKASYGTKVYAAADGVIEFSRTKYRRDTGYGKVVIINHGNGFKTLYGHLSHVTAKRGQKVGRWDMIGLSGNTGRATGPHLHYEVWKNGRSQNPEDFILN